MQQMWINILSNTIISETNQILVTRMGVLTFLLRLVVVVTCLAAGVFGRMAGRLSGGFGVLPSSFNCNDRPFGYYADIDHECRAFHVCFPVFTEEGEVRPLPTRVSVTAYFLLQLIFLQTTLEVLGSLVFKYLHGLDSFAHREAVLCP